MTGQSSIYHGALLAVAMRWSDRLLGFISTIVLARLLVPEDFGIVAMASLAIGLVEVSTSLGVNVALIQNENATRRHWNTAWTLRLIQTSVAGIAVALSAPLAAAYFSEPRVMLALPVMATGFFLTGLENIWVVEFQKKMQFRADFQFAFLKRITGFAITVACAWIFRSYWALIAGALAGRAIGVVLSYTMHPLRPRFSLATWREIFGISQWMVFSSIGAYLDGTAQSFIVGRREGAVTMGGYSLSRQISAMPTTEILMPLNRVLFPVFAQAKQNLVELKRLFLLAQRVQCLLAVPAGVGLAQVAPQAVPVLLGEQWLVAVPFVQVLAYASALLSVTTSSGYLLMTLGRVRNSAMIAWIRFTTFMLLVMLLFPDADALQIARIRLFCVFLGFLLVIWMTMRVLPNLKLTDLVRTVFRPVVAAVGMVAVLMTLDARLGIESAAVALIAKALVGAVTYASLVMAMWWCAGRPDGAETYLLRTVLKVNVRHGRRKNP
jgi:lipopolysaccharide exporter